MSRITEKKIDRWKTKRKLNKLIKAVIDENEKISQKAFEALNEIGGTEAVEDLKSALAYKKSNMRMAAAKALGKLKNKDAVSALRNSVKDKDEDVAAESINALGNILSKDSLDDIIESLKSNSVKISNAAEKAIVKFEEEAGDKVLTLLEAENKDYIKIRALKILKKIKYEKAADKLSDLIKENNKDIKEAATDAIIELKKTALKNIDDLLSEDSSKAYACRIIGETGANNYLSKLKELISHEDKSTLKEAIEAIGEIGSSKDLEELAKIYEKDEIKDIKPEKKSNKNRAGS